MKISASSVSFVLALLFGPPLTALAQTTVTYTAGQDNATNYDTTAPNNPTMLFANVGDATQSGVLSGSGGISKTGISALTLTAVNTFTGTTTLSAGTLKLSGAGSIAASGLLSIGSGTTFDISGLSGTGATVSEISSGAGSIVLGTKNLTFGNAASSIIGSAISGAGGSLTKVGNAIVTLSGTNTFDGGLTISAGTIVFNAAANLGTGLVTLSGGRLQWNNNNADISSRLAPINTAGSTLDVNVNDVTFASPLSGTAGFGKAGNGTLRLTAANTISGVVSVGGTLTLEGGGSLTAAGVNVATGGIFDISGLTAGSTSVVSLEGSGAVALGAKNLTFGSAVDKSLSGVISGVGGSLTKQGTGRITLTGTNTFDSGLTITQGAVSFNNDSNLGTGNITLNGGTLNWLTGNTTDVSARLLLGSTGGTLDTGSNNLSFATALGGAGGITKAGSGTLTLTTANTYAGGTTAAAGALVFGPGGLGGGTITLNGGTLRWAVGNTQDISAQMAALTSNGNNALDTNGNNVTLASPLTGASGRFSKVGSGTLTLTGASTFGGPTAISAGNLALSGAGSLVGDVSIAAGSTLDVSGAAGAGTTIGIPSGAGNIVLGAKSLTLNSNSTTTLTGAISGAGGSLVKQGSGTLTLTGTSTFDGGINITAGAIGFNTDANLGTGNVTLNGGRLFWATGNLTDISSRLNPLGASGGVVDVGTNDITFDSPVSGAGTFTELGAGILRLAAVNTYTGTTSIASGSLYLTASGSIASSSSVNLGSNTTLDISTISAAGATVNNFGGGSSSTIALGAKNLTVVNTSNNTINSVITGTGSLTKQGAATLQLSGTSTYSGGTTITGGSVIFTTDANFGVGNVTINGGGLIWNGTTDLSPRLNAIGASGATFDTNNKTITFASPLTGPGAITKTGLGTLTLSAASTYTGPTTVTSGGSILALTGAGSIASSSSLFVGSGGSMTISGITAAGTTVGTLSGDGGITLGTKNLTVNSTADSTYSGALSGTGSLTKTGSGALTLTSGGSTYNGTTVSGGSLILSGSATYLSGSNLTINTGGTFDVSGITTASISAGGFTGSGGTLALGSKNLILSSAADMHILSAIAGTGGLAKQNTDTVTLQGTNTYTGGTTLSGGTLVAFGPGSFPANTAYTVNAGTLDLGDNALTASSLKGSGGTVKIDLTTLTMNQTSNTTYSGVIFGAGALVKTGTGQLTLAGANTYSGGTAVNGGTLELGSSNAFVGGSGQIPVTLGGGSLINDGSISGSAGQSGFAGTLGFSAVGLSAPGSLTNTSTGSITGGAGGAANPPSGNAVAGNGAPGVIANSDLILTNAHNIAGGAGGNATAPAGSISFGGAGGNGVTVSGTGTATITNTGTILGGNGGSGLVFGLAGFGVQISGGGTVENDLGGIIQGGVFSGGLLPGVVADTKAATLVNEGIIYGGVSMGNFANAVTLFTGSQILSGSLQVGNSTTATLTLDGTATQVYSTAVPGSTTFFGTLVKQGAGTWTLDTSLPNVSAVTVNAGTLKPGSATSFGGNDKPFAVNGGTLDFGTSDLQIGQTSAGSLSIAAGGAVTSANAYLGDGGTGSGTATVSGTWTTTATNSVLSIGYDGTGDLTIAAGGIANSPEGRLGQHTGHGTATVYGTWNTSVNLGVGDNATGTLVVKNGGVINAGTGSFLGINASGKGTGTVESGGVWTSDGFLYDGYDGTGTLTIQAGGRAVAPTGTTIAVQSGSTGTLTVDGVAGNRGALETSSLAGGAGTHTVHFDGGTLRATADSSSFLNNFGPTGVIAEAGGMLIDSNGHNVTSLVGITGAGDVTKQGRGTLTFDAANPYTGHTVIEAGTLALDASGSIASSSGVQVDDGATFDVSATTFTLGAAQVLRGDGTIAGDVLSSGAIAPGVSVDAPGLLTFTGSLTLNPAGSVDIELSGLTPIQFDAVSVDHALAYAGTLQISLIDGFTPQAGDTFQIFKNFDSQSGSFSSIGFSDPDIQGSFDNSTGTLRILSVPEPSVWALLAGGLIFVFAKARRRSGLTDRARRIS